MPEVNGTTHLTFLFRAWGMLLDWVMFGDSLYFVLNMEVEVSW